MDVKPDLYIRQSFPELLCAAGMDTLSWLLLVITVPLLISSLDGVLSYDDLQFSLQLLMPALLLASGYVLVAGLTENFSRLVLFHFSGQTLEIRRGSQADQILLSRICHFRIQGFLLPTLHLYLNSSSRPMKISLYGLNRAHREEIRTQLNWAVDQRLGEVNEKRTAAAPISGHS